MRRFAVSLLASLFCFIVLAVGVVGGLYMTFKDAAPVKQALHDSGLYEGIALSVAEQVVRQHTATNGPQGAGPQPRATITPLRTALQQAVPPAYVEQQVNTALDAVYAWLDGSQETLRVQVETAQLQGSLAQAMGSYVRTHLASLPVCPAGQGMDAAQAPLQATCMPATSNIEAIVQKAQADITAQQAAGATSTTTVEVPATNAASPQSNPAVQALPALYQALVPLLLAGVVMAVVCGTGIIMFHTDRRRGQARLAHILLLTGASSLVLTLIARWLLHHSVQKFGAQGTEALRIQALDAVQSLAGIFLTWWTIYAIVLLAGGMGLVVFLRVTKPPNNPNLLPPHAEGHLPHVPPNSPPTPSTLPGHQQNRDLL